MKVGSSKYKDVRILEDSFMADSAVGLTASLEGVRSELVREIRHLIKIIALI